MQASRKKFAYSMAFTCLVLSCTFVGFASTSGKVFFKSDLSRGEGTFTFRPFVDVFPTWNFWGVFAEPLSFTGGTNLYVFRDGRALFTKWCDICSEEILAKGTYKFSKGKLTFFWESKPHSSEPPKIMYPTYGLIERSDFVTGFARYCSTRRIGMERLEVVPISNISGEMLSITIGK